MIDCGFERCVVLWCEFVGQFVAVVVVFCE